jgi:hypothetical protein
MQAQGRVRIRKKNTFAENELWGTGLPEPCLQVRLHLEKGADWTHRNGTVSVTILRKRVHLKQWNSWRIHSWPWSHPSLTSNFNFWLVSYDHGKTILRIWEFYGLYLPDYLKGMDFMLYHWWSWGNHQAKLVLFVFFIEQSSINLQNHIKYNDMALWILTNCHIVQLQPLFLKPRPWQPVMSSFPKVLYFLECHINGICNMKTESEFLHM